MAQIHHANALAALGKRAAIKRADSDANPTIVYMFIWLLAEDELIRRAQESKFMPALSSGKG